MERKHLPGVALEIARHIKGLEQPSLGVNRHPSLALVEATAPREVTHKEAIVSLRVEALDRDRLGAKAIEVISIEISEVLV